MIQQKNIQQKLNNAVKNSFRKKKTLKERKEHIDNHDALADKNSALYTTHKA